MSSISVLCIEFIIFSINALICFFDVIGSSNSRRLIKIRLINKKNPLLYLSGIDGTRSSYRCGKIVLIK